MSIQFYKSPLKMFICCKKICQVVQTPLFLICRIPYVNDFSAVLCSANIFYWLQMKISLTAPRISKALLLAAYASATSFWITSSDHYFPPIYRFGLHRYFTACWEIEKPSFSALFCLLNLVGRSAVIRELVFSFLWLQFKEPWSSSDFSWTKCESVLFWL